MDTLQKIFDATTLAQAVIGSFIFWLLFEACKRGIRSISRFIQQHNSTWRLEALAFERMQALAMSTEDAATTSNAMLTCIYGAISHAVRGLIYICFGLVTSHLLGPISLVAYGLAIIYFFRSYGAVALEYNSEKDVAYYAKRVHEIDEEIKKIEPAQKT